MKYQYKDFDISQVRQAILSILAAPASQARLMMAINAPDFVKDAALGELLEDGSIIKYYFKNSLGWQTWLTKPENYPAGQAVFAVCGSEKALKGLEVNLISDSEIFEARQATAEAQRLAQAEAAAAGELAHEIFVTERDEAILKELATQFDVKVARELASNAKSRADGFKGEDKARMLADIPGELASAKREYIKNQYHTKTGQFFPKTQEAAEMLDSFAPPPVAAEAEPAKLLA
jgi:hypothetical protein